MKKISLASVLFLIGCMLILWQYIHLSTKANGNDVDGTESSISESNHIEDISHENPTPLVSYLPGNEAYLSYINKSDSYNEDDQTSELEESNESCIETTEQEIKETEPVERDFLKMTPDEIRDFAALVYLEAGGESYECQLGVASVVVNRMMTNGLSFYSVVYAPNQFTPAPYISYTTGSQSCYDAVYEVLKNGPTLPWNCTYFRADYYHNWSSWLEDYTVIDNVYFSLDLSLSDTKSY